MLNAEIKEMITEGTYNKILELNWITADIDGDGIANTLDDKPYTPNEPATDGLPPHIDWGAQNKPAAMAKIQRELYEQHDILLVERSATFTPQLTYV